MYAWLPELRCCARSRWRRCDLDTDVQEGRTSHHASLVLPFVQAAMIHGKPLIASFDLHTETVSAGGLSIPTA